MTDASEPAYEGWAIVEIMGHRIVAGQVREVAYAGTMLLRVDVPGEGGTIAVTQFYGGGAIYAMTPCDEAAARAAIKDRYDLPDPVRLALPQPARQMDLPYQDIGDDEIPI